MHFPWLAILPILHALALAGLVAAVLYMKKHTALGGVLALLALLSAAATASLFLVLMRGGF